MMQEGMVHDPVKKVIMVKYPFIEAASEQPNNFRQIEKIQTSIEKRIDKDGIREEYKDEMRRMVASTAVRPLTEAVMREHKGGVHYLPHFPVLNPESSSTKLRCQHSSADLYIQNILSRKSIQDLRSSIYTPRGL